MTTFQNSGANGLPDHPYGVLEAYSEMQIWNPLETARTP
jgi:hypothetical protein